MRPLFAIAPVALLLSAGAIAQSSPLGGTGGLGGLLGGSGSGGGLAGGLGGGLGKALPGLGSVGVNNAAGVISYCLKNKYLSQGSAAGILGKLTGQPGVTSSPAFRLGQTGTIQTGTANTASATPGTFSIDSLKGQLRTKMCDAVLRHGASLL